MNAQRQCSGVEPEPFVTGIEFSVISIGFRLDSLPFELGAAPAVDTERFASEPISITDKLREFARANLAEQFTNFEPSIEVVDIFIVIQCSHLLDLDIAKHLSNGAQQLLKVLEINMVNMKIGVQRGSNEANKELRDFAFSKGFGEAGEAYAKRSRSLMGKLGNRCFAAEAERNDAKSQLATAVTRANTAESRLAASEAEKMPLKTNSLSFKKRKSFKGGF